MRRVLISLARQAAVGTLLLRFGIVGTNYVVMIGLAAHLGLAEFGTLAFYWSAALVVATLISFGGPVILLQALNSGRAMRPWDACALILVFPAALAGFLHLSTSFIWPEADWMGIVLAGFALNLIACLASVMRALGSVQMSMALRDAGPQVALALAAWLVPGQGALVILTMASVVMLFAAVACGVLCLIGLRGTDKLRTNAPPAQSGAQWVSAILGTGAAQVDLVIGGLLLAPEAMGLYALLRRIANLVALPVSVATWVSAAAVAEAHGHQDTPALQKASAEGSRVALIPGLGLLVVGFLALPLLPLLAPGDHALPGHMTFAILLFAAFGQVWFASSFTVATLCGRAADAALARGFVIGGYLLLVLPFLAGPGLLLNAGLYAVALTAGSLFLWVRLSTRLGVDTSGMVVLRTREGVSWKLS